MSGHGRYQAGNDLPDLITSAISLCRAYRVSALGETVETLNAPIFPVPFAEPSLQSSKAANSISSDFPLRHGYHTAYREDCVLADIETNNALVLSLCVSTVTVFIRDGKLTIKASIRADSSMRRLLTSEMSVFGSIIRVVVPRSSFHSTQVVRRSNKLRTRIRAK